MTHQTAAIILAAGKGTRMNSDLPKVVHETCGAPMVCWVARACLEAGCSRVIAVVGHRQELVREALERIDPGDASIEFAVQDEQLGTGHAVRCAQPLLEGFAGDIVVLCGDGPLIRAETIEQLIAEHRGSAAAATLATATVDDPSGYGRIVRDAAGAFVGIVEEKNATDQQKRIREINPSYYCFRADKLWSSLDRVTRNERSGEYYLTDVPSLLLAGGEPVGALAAVPAGDALSVNTPEQLAQTDRILRERLAANTTGASA
ncbi:MAG: NTP transferase domain-containing protein [Phycisphaeraceae bacterium]|nr:NTP transferase domain-containing protein [Phycisphaeraceae bacterium]MCB9848280.1 NTP transferase domain-containing protein [Phycisphaeraceae bacterium]